MKLLAAFVIYAPEPRDTGTLEVLELLEGEHAGRCIVRRRFAMPGAAVNYFDSEPMPLQDAVAIALERVGLLEVLGRRLDPVEGIADLELAAELEEPFRRPEDLLAELEEIERESRGGER